MGLTHAWANSIHYLALALTAFETLSYVFIRKSLSQINTLKNYRLKSRVECWNAVKVFHWRIYTHLVHKPETYSEIGKYVWYFIWLLWTSMHIHFMQIRSISYYDKYALVIHTYYMTICTIPVKLLLQYSTSCTVVFFEIVTKIESREDDTILLSCLVCHD